MIWLFLGCLILFQSKLVIISTLFHFAHSLWHQLHDHYSQIDGHRIYQLTTDIVHLKQANGSIEVYYHKLKGLWDELDALEAPYNCTCKCVCENGKTNGERDQRKRLIQFLMGLDESYTNIRGQILLLQPLPMVAKAYSMLRQEEKQRKVPKQTTQSIPFALNTYRNQNTNDSSRTEATRSARTRQSTNQTPNRISTFKPGVICGNCFKEGHTKEECYKLVGYPIGHPLHNKYQPPQRRSNNTKNHASSSQSRHKIVNMTMNEPLSNSMMNLPPDYSVTARMDQLQNQLNQVLLMMQNNSEASTSGSCNFMAGKRLIATYITKHKEVWIIDSGATDHICISISLMHNIITHITPIIIHLPNGQTVACNTIGSVTLQSNITLHNVLYIPTFTYNLISISKILQHTLKSITFTRNSCTF